MTRKLLDGREIQELAQPITLTVYTRCPEKYMLIDMETGQKYVGYATEGKHSWRSIDKTT